MKKTITLLFSLVCILAGIFSINVTATTQDFMCEIGNVGYTTLQNAVSAATENDTICLLASSSEAVSIDKNLNLNLNGFNIAEIHVADNKTISVYDTQTDDYNVSDNIYGKITVYSGNVVSAKDYLKLTENGQTSFHKTVRNGIAGMCRKRAVCDNRMR